VHCRSPLLHPSVLQEKDVFDKLFDQAPQKLETVKQASNDPFMDKR